MRNGAKRLVVVALAIAVASGVIACGGTDEQTFKGTTLGGQPFDLKAFKGRPVVVNFWASWCGYCGMEMPDVVAFAAAHPEIQVVGVDVKDQASGAQGFVQKYGMTFPQVSDPQGEIFSQFDSSGLPTTVFFDASLNVKHTIIGMTDRDGLEAGLRQAQ